jgi:hypothetical protein
MAKLLCSMRAVDRCYNVDSEDYLFEVIMLAANLNVHGGARRLFSDDKRLSNSCASVSFWPQENNINPRVASQLPHTGLRTPNMSP